MVLQHLPNCHTPQQIGPALIPAAVLAEAAKVAETQQMTAWGWGYLEKLVLHW